MSPLTTTAPAVSINSSHDICDPDFLANTECRHDDADFTFAECAPDGDIYVSVDAIEMEYFQWPAVDTTFIGVNRFCEAIDTINFDDDGPSSGVIDEREFVSNFTNPLEESIFGQSCVDRDAYLDFVNQMKFYAFSLDRWQDLGGLIQGSMGLSPQDADFVVFQDQCERQGQEFLVKPAIAAPYQESIVPSSDDEVARAVSEALGGGEVVVISSIEELTDLFKRPDVVAYMQDLCAKTAVEKQESTIQWSLALGVNPILRYLPQDVDAATVPISCQGFTNEN